MGKEIKLIVNCEPKTMKIYDSLTIVKDDQGNFFVYLSELKEIIELNLGKSMPVKKVKREPTKLILSICPECKKPLTEDDACGHDCEVSE